MPIKPVDAAIRLPVVVWNKTTNAAEPGLLYSDAKLAVGVFLDSAATHKISLTTITLADPATETTPYRWRELGNGQYDVLIPASGGGSYNNDACGTIHLYGQASGCYDFYSDKFQIVSAAEWERITTDNGGTGTGARSVTPTVDDGATALESARIRFTKGAESYVGTTDVNGQVAFSLDDGTWTVTISLAGYTFTPTTLVVDGTETPTYSMTSSGSIPVSEIGKTTGYYTALDEDGVEEEGVKIYLTAVQTKSSDFSGVAFDTTPRMEVSDAQGLVSFTNLVKGATYKLQRGSLNSPFKTMVKIPYNAGSTYALDNAFGAD